jgi:hypothetical protein
MGTERRCRAGRFEVYYFFRGVAAEVGRPSGFPGGGQSGMVLNRGGTNEAFEGPSAVPS